MSGIKISGITVHTDGRVEVGPPPPCSVCKGKQTYDDMQTMGSKVRVVTVCSDCGRVEISSN